MSHLVPVAEYTDAASMMAAAARRKALFYGPITRPVVMPKAAPPALPAPEAAKPVILREPESRHNCVWTEAEIAYLRHLVEEGKTIGALSLALRRTQEGIRGKCEALNLRVRSAVEMAPQEPDLDLSAKARGQRIAAVINAVSRMTGVTVVDIKSERKSRNFVRARWIVAWLLRNYSPLSLPKIGAALGGRDHSTVWHAAACLSDLLERDKVLEKRLRKLGAEVRRLFEEQP